MKIHNLLEKAIDRRKGLHNITNAMRIANGEADGLKGITIDRYNRHFVIQKFIPKSQADINTVKEFIIKRFNPEYLVLKERSVFNASNTANFTTKVLIDKSSPRTIITENGLKFLVDLNDNVNVGLFLDMRKNRKIISSLCGKRSVLNCFSYTCSFGVYCSSGNALKVVNVDISKKALDKGKENYRLNNLPAQEKEFVISDCRDYIAGAARMNNFFDIIILDVPTFSRHRDKPFLAKKELPKLIEMSINILKPKGHLFTSTNCSSVSVFMLKDFINKSASLAGIPIKKSTPLSQDTDFPKNENMKESYLAALLVDFK